MRMRMIVAIAAVALLVVVSAANAASVQCLNCNGAQMHAKARTLGASPTPHIVWNPANGHVKQYLNYCGSAPNVAPPDATKSLPDDADGAAVAAPCQIYTEDVPVPVELQQVASAMSEIWLSTGGTFRAAIQANVGQMPFPTYLPGGPTAHDFLRDVELQGQILALASTDRIFRLDSASTMRTPLAVIASHVDAFLSMSQGVIITVNVVFHDGSKVQIRLTVGDDATYVRGSGRDASGHVLPDPAAGNPQGYMGRWYYPPNQAADMSAFLEYMRSLGVTVTTGGDAGNGVISCIWNPATNTTTCYLPR
ncbi:MAG TPA: hypothetical protein VJ724_11105 [Tahibacter sp.]|nr:hypothetical protein [Tahibacter sp.]